MKRMIRATEEIKNVIPKQLRKEFDRLWNFVEGDPDEFMFSFEDLMNLDPSDRPAVYHKYPNYEDYAEIYLKEKES